MNKHAELYAKQFELWIMEQQNEVYHLEECFLSAKNSATLNWQQLIVQRRRLKLGKQSFAKWKKAQDKKNCK